MLLNVPGEVKVNETYEMSEKGIAWTSDKELYKQTKTTDYDKIVPPKYWQDRFPDGRYTDEYPPPNIGEDEHFMVWMRTAGLPDFSKLYARNDTHPMVAGTYSLEIIDSKFQVIFLTFYATPMSNRIPPQTSERTFTLARRKYCSLSCLLWAATTISSASFGL